MFFDTGGLYNLIGRALRESSNDAMSLSAVSAISENTPMHKISRFYGVPDQYIQFQSLQSSLALVTSQVIGRVLSDIPGFKNTDEKSSGVLKNSIVSHY